MFRGVGRAIQRAARGACAGAARPRVRAAPRARLAGPGRRGAECPAVNRPLASLDPIDSKRLQFVADTVPALLAYLDDGARYVWVNEAYRRWFGRSPESIVGRHAREIVGEAAWAAVRTSRGAGARRRGGLVRGTHRLRPRSHARRPGGLRPRSRRQRPRAGLRFAGHRRQRDADRRAGPAGERAHARGVPDRGARGQLGGDPRTRMGPRARCAGPTRRIGSSATHPASRGRLRPLHLVGSSRRSRARPQQRAASGVERPTAASRPSTASSAPTGPCA